MHQRRPSASRPLAILAVVALALLALAPGTSAHGRPARGSGFAVTHGPVTITLADTASDGHQLGDLRVTTIPVLDEAGAEVVGRLDSTLTTVGIDSPEPGDEIRISVLVFSFADAADQLVVQGTGFYPRAGGTIAQDTTIERPITGGSGAFAGATGWAETEHLADGTWRHTFSIAGGSRRGLPHRPFGRHDATHEEPEPSSEPAPAGGIIRTLLGETQPTEAQGESLSLWHYTIPPGQALVPHTHPGFQVAHIVSGELTYNVIEGEVTVLRGDGTSETVGSGAVITLGGGDTVIENPDVSHYGANQGPEPVILYASSLFTTGEAPAQPLPSTAP